MLDAGAALHKIIWYLCLLYPVGYWLATLTLGAKYNTPWLRPLPKLSLILAALSLVLSLVFVYLLVLRLGGTMEWEFLTLILDNNIGFSLLTRMIGAILMIVAITNPRLFNVLSLLSSGLIIYSFSASGHSASNVEQNGLVAPIALFIHIAGLAWWLGSLSILHAACSELNSAQLEELLRRFSKQALLIVMSFLLAAALTIAALLDFSLPIFISNYIFIFSIKMILVLVVLALVIYNKFILSPKIYKHEADAPTKLKQVIKLELTLIVLIFIVTGLLTSYSITE